jgi:3-oxosteroid 1-dehydrogenase
MASKEERNRVSRRQVLKGAVLGGTGLATAALPSGMAAKAGAAMWHFNSLFGRLTTHLPGYPGLKGGTPDGFIHVNKYGKRFFRERPLPGNSLPVEACVFDNEKAEYPAIPCWSIFDDTALKLGDPITSAFKGLLNGKVQHWYTWSKDGVEEIKSGFLLKAETIENLAKIIAADKENGGRMRPEVLHATVERYNRFSAAKKDDDFERDPSTLIAVAKPPYYGMKLYPGGAMTTGGPKKNIKAQVLDPFNNPIPHLYCVGEMGVAYGVVYPMPGINIGELLIFGRVAGENVVKEKAV